MNTGKIVQVVGPVVDVEFTQHLPAIYNALTVDFGVEDKKVKLTLEVQQHLGDNWVRTVSMSGTEGLKRGYEVIDTGAPISVPVGEGVMGRIFDVCGNPVDERGPVKAEKYYPIHRPAPKLVDQSTSPQVLATGIKVVDMTEALAGPYCAMLLGDLGADVVKVERPGEGDQARSWGPPFLEGESAYFLSINRNKRSIELDTKNADNLRVLHTLIGRADVFLTNNPRLESLARATLDPATLRARHPRLVYGAASGFGQTGPLRERPAFDLVVQAMGGVMSLTGYPDGPPARVGVSIGDMVAGLYLAVGIHAALLRRVETP